MKRTIAAIIAGLLIGTTGTAIAATTSGFWQQSGNSYSCQGSPRSVSCKETGWKTNYSIAFTPNYVIVSFGSRVIFGCDRPKQPQYNCDMYVQGR